MHAYARVRAATIDDCSMFEQRAAYCHADLYHEEVLDLDSPFVTKARRHPARAAAVRFGGALRRDPPPVDQRSE
jgi:hypothetical protein